MPDTPGVAAKTTATLPRRVSSDGCARVSATQHPGKRALASGRLLPEQRHLIPSSPIQQAPRGLLVAPTPLLEEERHASIDALIADGFNLFIEVGPHAVLRTYVNDCLRAASRDGRAPSARARSVT